MSLRKLLRNRLHGGDDHDTGNPDLRHWHTERKEWFHWGEYSGRYHLWVPPADAASASGTAVSPATGTAAATTPTGLMVWFHGDGAHEFDHPDDDFYIAGPRGVLAVAQRHNMALLLPETPDDHSRTWWRWAGPDDLSGYATALINETIHRYGIDRSRVVLCGFSGGAEFLSHDLIPDCGPDLDITDGLQIIIGGGTPPDTPPTAGTPPTSTKKTAVPDSALRPHWHCRFIVGENDIAANAADHFDAVEAATAGDSWWRAAGWDSALTVLPGEGHLMAGCYGDLVERQLQITGFAPSPPTS